MYATGPGLLPLARFGVGRMGGADKGKGTGTGSSSPVGQGRPALMSMDTAAEPSILDDVPRLKSGDDSRV